MAKEPYSVWVSWMNGTEDISHAMEHDISAYGGIVPQIGDRIVTDWSDGYDTFEVVERYLIQGTPEHARWHIILQPIDLPIRRDYALHLTEEAKDLQARLVADARKVSLGRIKDMHSKRNEEEAAPRKKPGAPVVE